MLEINKIRNHIKYYSEALKKRGIDKTNDQLNTVILLDDQRKSLKSQLDKILTESNSISKEIGVNIQSGNATKIENLKKRSSELKENSKKVSEALKESESKIKNILIDIPNVPDNKVPDGNSDKNNIIISSSDIKLFKNKKLKPHWDLIKEFNLIDFETGNNVTGAGFPVYIDKGAKLQRALINYFLDNPFVEYEYNIKDNEEIKKAINRTKYNLQY